MNPQQSTESAITPDSQNISFTPAPGPTPPAKTRTVRKTRKAAISKEVMMARLSGPPSQAGTVNTKELILENRLRARAAAGSNQGAARITGDSARSIKTAWEKYGGPLLTYPATTPVEERQPLQPLPDNSETSTDD